MDDIQFTIPKKTADWLLEYGETPERTKGVLSNGIVMPYGVGHQVVLSKPTLEEIQGLRFALEQGYIYWSIQCDKLDNEKQEHVDAVAHRRRFGKLLDKMDDWPGLLYMPVGNPI